MTAGAPAPSARAGSGTCPSEVVIVGAGPYGLSLASHLDAAGVSFRIFGSPMGVWRTNMPADMCLKSDGFASDLYDPDRHFTLQRYCRDRGIRYADYGVPVRVDVFTEYGLAFQRQLVPTLREQHVVRIDRQDGSYTVHLADGEVVAAKSVVIATGISYFEDVPTPLSNLPRQVCVHSSAVHDLSRFAGQHVLVVGGGASATDLAALLTAQGTSVELICRSPLEFHRPPNLAKASLWNRITEPNLGLGPNFRSALYTAFPGLFRLLPRQVRRRIVHRHLGPAGAWFNRDQVIGHVPIHTGYEVTSAAWSEAGVELRGEDAMGRCASWQGSQVIAATGYRVAVQRLDFIGPAVRASIRSDRGSPVLSGNFESTAPGLYFVGIAAARSFGPVMRFARGAEYTARRLSRHLLVRSRHANYRAPAAAALS
jgi:hypothetical protein